MNLRVSVLLLSCLALAPVRAEAPLTPMDFSQGHELQVQAGQALHELTLPTAIHRGVTRADLGDLRVFNRAGQIVPHALRESPLEARAAARRVLPHFTVAAPPAGARADLFMTVRTRPDGTIVDVRSLGRGRPGAGGTAAQVIDASQTKQPLHALELAWATPVAGFFTSVDVEASDDLQHWRRVKSRAPVASLEQGGHRLEQRRIELDGVRAKYLRLRWVEAGAPTLTRVSVELVPEVPPPRLDWERVSASADDTGGLRFDLSGPLRAERLRIVPREHNSIAQIELLSRPDARTPWRVRGTALIYRLTVEGRTIEQQEAAVAAGTDREWLLRVANRESAFGGQPPTIDVGYRPAQLVFVARGEGPFLLAYGSGRAGPAARPLEGLLLDMARGDQKAVPARASLGAVKMLGGPDALRAPISPRDWKVMALWAVLVAGVLLLAWMAHRLIRQLSSGGPGGAAPPPAAG